MLIKRINKKIIAVVLVALVTFTTILINKSKTDVKTVETQKIEMTNQNKIIGIKNKGEMTTMRNSNITTITINGKQYTGKKIQVKASAYTTAKDEGGSWAYNGEKLKVGQHIAVDFKVIPMNTMVYIPQLGKIYKAVDTGSAIKGNKIDILMSTKQQCKQWGVKDLEIIILDQN